eukprot:508355-Prymnesium_polylepis.1
MPPSCSPCAARPQGGAAAALQGGRRRARLRGDGGGEKEAAKEAAALSVTLTAVDNAAMIYLVSHHNIKSWYYHNGV